MCVLKRKGEWVGSTYESLHQHPKHGKKEKVCQKIKEGKSIIVYEWLWMIILWAQLEWLEVCFICFLKIVFLAFKKF